MKNITQSKAAEMLGINESFFSRRKPAVRAALMDSAIRLQGLESDCKDLKEWNKVLTRECNHLKSECASLQSTCNHLQDENKELQDVVTFMKSEMGLTESKVRFLQKELAILQEQKDELQEFKNQNEGENMVTQFLGSGKMTTALSIGLASYTFFALWTLGAIFFSPLESFSACVLASFALLHFTIKKNKFGRLVCVAMVFVVVALFHGYTWHQLPTELQNGWTISTAIVLSLFMPTLEYLATKEIK